ncbi:hypothetical protein CCAX7_54380 [Capsulimonas corticalis]|uniref:Uncharacterized protein n=1 Tax=Capsulimonas corticalis TaxID=2219043 RepID=A0A402D5V8_9BACT|nr:hypothetical protein [Capsulimonas corticalis]BDI33387.1 hypothetical protein CCAX7_54380 [Capsulimonas corticalis]
MGEDRMGQYSRREKSRLRSGAAEEELSRAVLSVFDFGSLAAQRDPDHAKSNNGEDHYNEVHDDHPGMSHVRVLA